MNRWRRFTSSKAYMVIGFAVGITSVFMAWLEAQEQGAMTADARNGYIIGAVILFSVSLRFFGLGQPRPAESDKTD